MASELRANEVEKCEMAFSVFGDKDTMDCVGLADCLRALNLNPSLETLESFGATKKSGEKSIKFEEFLTIYATLKKDVKDMGCYEDFIECLKLYDKAENGKMSLGELSHGLLALGEKLTDAEVNILFDDCLGDEDDEGQIDYIPFLQKMCDRMDG